MRNKYLFSLIVLFLYTTVVTKGNIAPPCELVCGKWESLEKNLIVQVYMDNDKFRAKIIWFNDGDEQGMHTCTDVRNPDPLLRDRKILGMEVLKDLTYNTDSNSWEGGKIYDAKHGREWDASAMIDKNGLLRVKGYWHFKFIGKTMTFKRVLS